MFGKADKYEVKVLIADDHVLFRESLAYAITPLDADLIIIEAGTAEEALFKSDESLDLILLDLSMAGRNSLPIIKKLTDKVSPVPIVIISGSEEPSDIANSIILGACGYIPKTYSSLEIMDALGKILLGEVFIPEEYKLQVDRLLYPNDGSLEIESGLGLTQGQLSVLKLMAEGISNKEIGYKLDITEGTVKSHVTSILKSLGASNRTKAILIAIKLELIKGLS